MKTVSISYARVDKNVCSRLAEALRPLEDGRLIKVWVDFLIMPGDFFENEIGAAISKADIILVMASNGYFVSRYCSDVELPLALGAMGKNGARVIPVIVDECPWQASPLAGLQALPQNGIPLSKQPSEAMAIKEIVKSIETVLQADRPMSGSDALGALPRHYTSLAKRSAKETRSNNNAEMIALGIGGAALLGGTLVNHDDHSEHTLPDEHAENTHHDAKLSHTLDDDESHEDDGHDDHY